MFAVVNVYKLENQSVCLTMCPFIIPSLQDLMVKELGTVTSPWQIVVSLRSGTGHSDAVLSGTLTAYATDGWFNFTDLAISHKGDDYVLDFKVIYPTTAAHFTTTSAPIDEGARPLTSHVVANTPEDVVQNDLFNLTLDLRDLNTGKVISEIGWRVS